jgi:hypothetical protein
MQLCVDERRIGAHGNASEDQGQAEMRTTCGRMLLSGRACSEACQLRIRKHRVNMLPQCIQSGSALLQ